jgi:hypothetical protein
MFFTGLAGKRQSVFKNINARQDSRALMRQARSYAPEQFNFENGKLP